MEGVRAFLDSSSIAGLNQIPASRRLAKLFWITIISSGFICSGVLIHQSFQSWRADPVKTRTDTLPISELKLPKLTVCPPKNTFTDLNYDLMRAKNLTAIEKQNFQDFVISVFEDQNTKIDEWRKLIDDKMYFNWYWGYTIIDPPRRDKRNSLNYDILTNAASGRIKTLSYGDPFDQRLIELTRYTVTLRIPEAVQKNFTLHVEVEKVSLPKDIFKINSYRIGTNEKFVYKNFSPPFTNMHNKVSISQIRYDKSSSERINITTMPGFIFRWYYTGDKLEPEDDFIDDEFVLRRAQFKR